MNFSTFFEYGALSGVRLRVVVPFFWQNLLFTALSMSTALKIFVLKRFRPVSFYYNV